MNTAVIEFYSLSDPVGSSAHLESFQGIYLIFDPDLSDFRTGQTDVKSTAVSKLILTGFPES
jgi:hypothetical protein